MSMLHSMRGSKTRKVRFLLTLLIAQAAMMSAHFDNLPTASATTCGSESPAQIGYDGYSTPPASWGQTPEGVSAYIMARNGPVCSNKSYPYTWSTAWVMLQDNGVSNHYAQAGYMYDNTSGCMRLYDEYNIGGGFTRHLGACVTQGVRVTALVEYTGGIGPYPPAGDHGMTMQTSQPLPIALSNYMPFDPWQLGWSFQPTFFGEVDHSGPNDVPGSSYATADISAMGIQRVSDGATVTIPCYLLRYTSNLPIPNRYYASASGCDHIRVWTYPF
jgi:hypothetical protein